MAEQKKELPRKAEDKPKEGLVSAKITKSLPWWVEASYTQDLCAH